MSKLPDIISLPNNTTATSTTAANSILELIHDTACTGSGGPCLAVVPSMIDEANTTSFQDSLNRFLLSAATANLLLTLASVGDLETIYFVMEAHDPLDGGVGALRAIYASAQGIQSLIGGGARIAQISYATIGRDARQGESITFAQQCHEKATFF